MPLNPEISRFIREHLDDNPDQLLWKKNEYPDDRVVVAVEQIQAREYIKEKLPSWYACQNIFLPVQAIHRTMLIRDNSSLQGSAHHG